MSHLPFGVSQYTTWPLTFEQDLDLYVKLGIPYIEVCEAKLEAANPEPQLRKLQESGLRVTSVQPRLHSLFPDFPRPEPKAPAARMTKLRQSIELFGRYFPGVTLVTISGAAPNGDYSEAYRTAVREYKEAAKIAADCGVRLALEPLNPILMNVDTFLCSIAHAGRVIEGVDHPHFGLFVDVWHIWEDVEAPALMQTYSEKIFGVHVNDWRDPRAFGDRYLPGEGKIPLIELLRSVRRTGYAGVYTLEIFSETHLSGSLWSDPQRTIAAGTKGFARIWEQVCA